MDRLELLLIQTDEVYSRLSERLRGLSDEEYFWQPVPDCWTVHQVGDRWVADYDADPPDPPPFTTIAWALAHLTQGKTVYHDWAWGSRSMAFADVVPAPTAAGAVADLDRAHATLRGAIAGLSDAELDGEVPTALGERWPAWQIASRFSTTTRTTAPRSRSCATCSAPAGPRPSGPTRGCAYPPADVCRDQE